MIGYYIHHVGHGHLHRALAIVAQLPGEITAISSLPPHPDWPGRWLTLARDDNATDAVDATAGGRLHWVPRHDRGLQQRMAQLVEWMAANRPSVMVVDLSVEVILQARLLGVPVVTMALPGSRTDHAHQLGYQLADAIVAPWPAELTGIGAGLLPYRAKVRYTGAISRYAGRAPTGRVSSAPTGRLHVLTLSGSGGAGGAPLVAAAGWESTTLSREGWSADPWPMIARADVVVTHAGLGALADVATAGRPAIVLPQPRPHDEQLSTARGLADRGLTTVLFETPSAAAWPALLESARRRGGSEWSRWLSGAGAAGAAEVIGTVAATALARV